MDSILEDVMENLPKNQIIELESGLGILQDTFMPNSRMQTPLSVSLTGQMRGGFCISF